MSSTRDRRAAQTALEHISRLRSHVARGDLSDLVVMDAVCLRLSAAIESAGRLEEPTRELLFGAAWPAIWATCNHIAHAYVSVDPAIIAATLGADLDAFEDALRSVR